MVVLKGVGEKVFCVGGDVVSLYKVMSIGEFVNYIEDFFIYEYKLDYLIYCYEKLILFWGNGIVMGGGFGLMVGVSYCVVIEILCIVMFELIIGLYLDVGGSYFLYKMFE